MISSIKAHSATLSRAVNCFQPVLAADAMDRVAGPHSTTSGGLQYKSTHAHFPSSRDIADEIRFYDGTADKNCGSRPGRREGFSAQDGIHRAILSEPCL